MLLHPGPVANNAVAYAVVWDVQGWRTGFPNSPIPLRCCSSSTRSGNRRARESAFPAWISIRPSVRFRPLQSPATLADQDPLLIAAAAACDCASSLPWRSPGPREVEPVPDPVANRAAKLAAILVCGEQDLSQPAGFIRSYHQQRPAVATTLGLAGHPG